MRIALFALLAGTQALAAIAQTPADRWNLADLYPSVAAWDADVAKVEAQMKEFSRCKGHLADSASRLKLCLNLQADMTKRYLRMVVYSSQLLAEDTGAAASLELVQKGRVIGTRLNEAGSFVNPEVLRMGKQKVATFIAQDAGL